MADEVEMIPVAGTEPPKANPLATATHSPVAAAKPTLKPGLKLPPKPAAAFKPGLKLPTQTALRPGLKLPARPVIRKPGATAVAAPMPKPVAPVAAPKPLETLKAVTQKLKGITQEIPQQAILRKTGIIADSAMSETQKEAAKHKTARISLADAMGVAPVKEPAAPMKTIRIKRPVNVPGATATVTPQPSSPTAPTAVAAAATAAPTTVPPAAPAAAPAAPAAAPAAADQSATVTQRKTLKITRPGGVAARPASKFGIKRPATQASTVLKKPTVSSAPDPAAADTVADIPDLPPTAAPISVAPLAPVASAVEGPAWAWTLSVIVQIAACLAMGALAWFLYENSQLATFCGGLGWGV